MIDIFAAAITTVKMSVEDCPCIQDKKCNHTTIKEKDLQVAAFLDVPNGTQNSSAKLEGKGTVEMQNDQKLLVKLPLSPGKWIVKLMGPGRFPFLMGEYCCKVKISRCGEFSSSNIFASIQL